MPTALFLYSLGLPDRSMLQRPLGIDIMTMTTTFRATPTTKKQQSGCQHRPLIGKDQLHCRRYNLQDLSHSSLRTASDQELRLLCRKAPPAPATAASLTAIMALSALADGKKITIGHDCSLAPGAPRLSPRSCPGCRVEDKHGRPTSGRSVSGKRSFASCNSASSLRSDPEVGRGGS